MRLRLDQLGLRSGQRYEATHALELSPIVLGGTKYEVAVPTGARVVVERITGGFLASVSVEARVSGPCVRCLTETDTRVRGEEQEFAPSTPDSWTEAESSSFIEDLVLDVSGLCREAVVLALPERLLCCSECKGLCPQCGCDLNRGTCTCSGLDILEPMR